MKSSFIITISAFLFILCGGILFFIVNRDLNPDYDKDWFAIGFIHPADDAPDFTLYNHSSNTAFHYTLKSSGKIITEDSFSLNKGESLDIHPNNTNLPKPYTLSVFPENDTKKIESLTRK